MASHIKGRGRYNEQRHIAASKKDETGNMSDERRQDERFPNIRYVKLVAPQPGGEEKLYPLILRDVSSTGLGGLFIGTEALDPEGEYLLRDPAGAERLIRIIWTRKVADLVHILGMRFVDN
jgi:hypothetical protein